MSNSSKRSNPFSVRLTEAEQAALRQLAGGQPLGTFIRETVLAGHLSPRKAQRQPVKDGVELGRIMGWLGRSHLANNLNQLAKAANQGALPVTQELEKELWQACEDIRAMRLALMRALGITPPELPPVLAEIFARHAAPPNDS